MNRRSFITKALAAVAVVPVVGKLAPAQSPPLEYAEQEFPMCGFNAEPETLPHYSIKVERYPDPPVWIALGTHENNRFVELDGGGYERVPLKKGDLVFPRASDRWPEFDSVGIAFSKDDPVMYSGPLAASCNLTLGDTITLHEFGFVVD